MEFDDIRIAFITNELSSICSRDEICDECKIFIDELESDNDNKNGYCDLCDERSDIIVQIPGNENKYYCDYHFRHPE